MLFPNKIPLSLHSLLEGVSSLRVIKCLTGGIKYTKKTFKKPLKRFGFGDKDIYLCAPEKHITAEKLECVY